MSWLTRITFALRRAWLRLMVWGLDMDIAILEDRARRMAQDRSDFARRRSDLIVELINLENEGSW